MPKRCLSPALLPRAKRAHFIGPTAHTSELEKTFDNLLYDEVVLHIFSYLSASDLCAIQNCSRNWERLSQDEQLWKRLYLEHFGRARLRGSRGASQRLDGKNVKPLPERVPQPSKVDWKWMYRISSNWRNGRCTVDWIDSDVGSYQTLDLELSPERNVPALVVGDMIITPSSEANRTSSLSMRCTSNQTHKLKSQKLAKRQLAPITCLTQDQSAAASQAPGHKIAVFYASGSFATFTINVNSPDKSREEDVYSPQIPSDRTSPIIIAAYHHPLLITLSSSFHLSSYKVDNGMIVHQQTLSSFTSYPPSSLVLSNPAPQYFKLLLAYTVPVYPSHWGAATTELTISTISSNVISSRTRRAFDVPFGWVDEAKLKLVREQWARKVPHVAATATDGKWVVLAGADNTIQVYKPTGRYSPGQLTFVRSLHGHIGRIHSVALADARCVSVGEDGSVWVWDLEADWGVEVRAGRADTRMAGHVVFDERRILCIHEGGLEVSRFDI